MYDSHVTTALPTNARAKMPVDRVGQTHARGAVAGGEINLKQSEAAKLQIDPETKQNISNAYSNAFVIREKMKYENEWPRCAETWGKTVLASGGAATSLTTSTMLCFAYPDRVAVEKPIGKANEPTKA